MTRTWQDATLKYQLSNKTKNQPEESLLQKDIDQATRDLEQFMNSEEGRSAMELLAASGKRICFSTTRGTGCWEEVIINGNGLHYYEEEVVQIMNSRFDPNSDEYDPGSDYSPITALKVIEAAIKDGEKKPSEVMSWLRGELDKIASSAPQTPID